MRLTYFGHSCFRVEVDGATLVIDPWLRGNPHGPRDPASIPCDFVLCTHAHSDHMEDALPLVQAHGATLVAPYELAEYFAARGAPTIDLMPGGAATLPWGRIKMTPAVHSSALELDGGENKSMGMASGYLIFAGGRTLYHAGDTALFGDMALIGRHAPDVALVPIGDFYTMGPEDAIAALDLLRPGIAVPMHYNSNPKIQQDPQAFAAAAKRAGHHARVLAVGEVMEL